MGTIRRDQRPATGRLAAHPERVQDLRGSYALGVGHVDLQGLTVEQQEAHPLVPQLRLDELLTDSGGSGGLSWLVTWPGGFAGR